MVGIKNSKRHDREADMTDTLKKERDAWMMMFRSRQHTPQLRIGDHIDWYAATKTEGRGGPRCSKCGYSPNWQLTPTRDIPRCDKADL
jgi:hypothetical protein